MVCTLSGRIENKQPHAIDRYSPTCSNRGNWASNQSTLRMSLNLTPLSKCIYPSVAPSLLHQPTLSNCYSAGRGSHDIGNIFVVGASSYATRSCLGNVDWRPVTILSLDGPSQKRDVDRQGTRSDSGSDKIRPHRGYTIFET